MKTNPVVLVLLMVLAVCAPAMTAMDVAKYLGVTDRAVRNMVADGRLRAWRLGGRVIRFRRDEIDAAMQPMGRGAL